MDLPDTFPGKFRVARSQRCHQNILVVGDGGISRNEDLVERNAELHMSLIVPLCLLVSMNLHDGGGVECHLNH